MQAYNTLIRLRREGTELYLAKMVVSFSNDTVFGSIIRFRNLAEQHNIMVTGSPSTRPSAGRKRRALVRSHCMNVRQSAGLLRVEDVVDLNLELDKPVLVLTDLMIELVRRQYFTQEQVVVSALNRQRMRSILDERLAWDESVSDKELSRLLEDNAELNMVVVQDPAPVDEELIRGKDEELQSLKTQLKEVKEEKEKLYMELQQMEQIKLENEMLRSELDGMRMAKGDVLRSVGSELMENALKGKVVVSKDRMGDSVRSLQDAVDELARLVRVSTLMD